MTQQQSSKSSMWLMLSAVGGYVALPILAAFKDQTLAGAGVIAYLVIIILLAVFSYYSKVNEASGVDVIHANSVTKTPETDEKDVLLKVEYHVDLNIHSDIPVEQFDDYTKYESQITEDLDKQLTKRVELLTKRLEILGEDEDDKSAKQKKKDKADKAESEATPEKSATPNSTPNPNPTPTSNETPALPENASTQIPSTQATGVVAKDSAPTPQKTPKKNKKKADPDEDESSDDELTAESEKAKIESWIRAEFATEKNVVPKGVHAYWCKLLKPLSFEETPDLEFKTCVIITKRSWADEFHFSRQKEDFEGYLVYAKTCRADLVKFQSINSRIPVLYSIHTNVDNIECVKVALDPKAVKGINNRSMRGIISSYRKQFEDHFSMQDEYEQEINEVKDENETLEQKLIVANRDRISQNFRKQKTTDTGLKILLFIFGIWGVISLFLLGMIWSNSGSADVITGGQ